MTIYKGSCHCGGIAFEVEGAIDSGLACNCSICPCTECDINASNEIFCGSIYQNWNILRFSYTGNNLK